MPILFYGRGDFSDKNLGRLNSPESDTINWPYVPRLLHYMCYASLWCDMLIPDVFMCLLSIARSARSRACSHLRTGSDLQRRGGMNSPQFFSDWFLPI